MPEILEKSTPDGFFTVVIEMPDGNDTDMIPGKSLSALVELLRSTADWIEFNFDARLRGPVNEKTVLN